MSQKLYLAVPIAQSELQKFHKIAVTENKI